VVVEPAERLGEGIAYGTTSPSHLLNVRAAGMSAFADRPIHFTDWARRTGLTLGGTEFLPRRLYPRYLRESLTAALRAAHGMVVRHVRAHAAALRTTDDGAVVVRLDDGTDLPVGDAILATGNGRAPLEWLPDIPGVVRDPWVRGALDGMRPRHRVVIVGSGLTAVDVVLSLRDAGHAGPILLVSSHGLLPLAHAPGPLAPRAPAIDPVRVTGVRALVRALREDAGTAEDWRQTIDGMRPVTIATWRTLADGERRRALRHAFRHWEVHRHRMAPQVADLLDELRARGQLRLVRGRVRGVAATHGALAVRIRSAGVETSIPADLVVACVGPSADPLHDPLLATAIAEGLVARHPLGLGLAVDVTGRALRPDGSAHPHLWTTGSLRKGAEWESTAIPELRLHARDIAAALTGGG
jgi:uncharacterized NAD(P)/FAD-binding protein YdhS